METKISFERRVRFEGLWDVWLERREALRREGVVGKDARAVFALEHPAREGSGVEESLGSSGVEVETNPGEQPPRPEGKASSGERKSAAPSIPAIPSGVAGKVVVDWVAENMSRPIESIRDEEYPNRTAQSFLQQMAKYPMMRVEFMKNVWPKFNAPAKEDVERDRRFRDDGRGVMELVEECREWAREAVGGLG